MAKNKKRAIDIEEQVIEEEQPTVVIEEEANITPKAPKEMDSADIPDELQAIIDNCGNDTSYSVSVF